MSLFTTMFATAQTRVQVKKDTVVINNGDLQINNSTKNVQGYLYNVGNGLTQFKPLDTTVVLTTGNQTITGVKKFAPTGLSYRMSFGATNGAQTNFLITDTTSNIKSSLITSDLSVIAANNTAPGASIISAGSSGGNRAVFKGVRSRGSLTNPTAPVLNDEVLSFLGAIYDGSTTQATAMVDFLVDGTVSSGVAPQRISFWTSPGAAASRTERLQVLSSGMVMLPTASTINASGGIARGLYVQPTLVSTANNDNMFGAYFAPFFSAGSFTGQNMYSALFNRKLFVTDGAEPVMIGADAGALSLTANTEKQMRIALPHYSQSGFATSTSASVLFAQSNSTQNIINVGGASSNYAATDIKFYTAGNNTTATGTLAGRFSNTQGFIVTNDITAKHFTGGSSTPTIAAGAAAGTSATMSVTGTDAGGEITLTTGTDVATGTLFTITFATPYAATPRGHILDAYNDQAIIDRNKVGITAISTTTFTVKAVTALAASTQYKWSYVMVQ